MPKNSVPGVRPSIHLLDAEADLIGDLALRAEQRAPLVSAMLLAEIERAQIHDIRTLPADAVTLDAGVDYLDERSGQSRTVTIVTPGEADISAGRISILTPVGAGLIGLRAGQTIDWPDVEGRDHRLRILAVRQPMPDAA